jgi:hypothetical protein
MRTTENLTDPVSELIRTQQTIGLEYLALAVDPLGLYRVQPRTLLRQQAADDPYSFTAALFDLSGCASRASA